MTHELRIDGTNSGWSGFAAVAERQENGAGDVVYNGIHPFLSESNRQTRLEWIAALDKIDALRPSAVVAGHKIPRDDDRPRHVEETRQYIRDSIRLNDATKTAAEFYDKMLELYPDRVNPGSPWSAAAAAKAQS